MIIMCVFYDTVGVDFMGTLYIKGIARNVTRRFHKQTRLIKQWQRPLSQVPMGLCSCGQVEICIHCMQEGQAVCSTGSI